MGTYTLKQICQEFLLDQQILDAFKEVEFMESSRHLMGTRYGVPEYEITYYGSKGGKHYEIDVFENTASDEDSVIRLRAGWYEENPSYHEIMPGLWPEGGAIVIPDDEDFKFELSTPEGRNKLQRRLSDVAPHWKPEPIQSTLADDPMNDRGLDLLERIALSLESIAESLSQSTPPALTRFSEDDWENRDLNLLYEEIEAGTRQRERKGREPDYESGFVRPRRDRERDYFDVMTDGMLGDYDDFVRRGGSIDWVDEWAGR